MTELIVTVEESKSKFIMKLLREFDYVKVKKKPKKYSAADQKILDSISEGVDELNRHKRGEIELQDAFEMLNELKEELKAEESEN
jgi:hypothetical protein